MTIGEAVIETLRQNGGSMTYGKLRREVRKLDKKYDICMADMAILGLMAAKKLGSLQGCVHLIEKSVEWTNKT